MTMGYRTAADAAACGPTTRRPAPADASFGLPPATTAVLEPLIITLARVQLPRPCTPYGMKQYLHIIYILIYARLIQLLT
jgi:hypothetical protein